MKKLDSYMKYSFLIDAAKANSNANPELLLEEIKAYMDKNGLESYDQYFEFKYYDGCSSIYIEDYEKVETIGEELIKLSALEDKSKGLIYGHNLIGIARLNNDDMSSALNHYLIAYKIAIGEEEIRLSIVVLMNICYLFLLYENFNEFDKYIEKCIDLAKNNDEKRLYFKTLIFKSMRWLKKNKWDTAQYILQSAELLKNNTDNKLDLFYYYHALGKTELIKCNFEKSYENFKLAEELIENFKMKRIHIMHQHEMIQYYLCLEKPYEALEILETTWDLAQNLNNRYYIKKTILLFAECYEKLYDFKNANHYYRQYIDLERNYDVEINYAAILCEKNIGLKNNRNIDASIDYFISLQNQCNLTKREIEIVNKISVGNPNRVIAEELLISENTVKNHLKNIYKKMHLNSRYELISYVIDQKIP